MPNHSPERFVYVLEADNNRLKVGISQNVHSRHVTHHQHSPAKTRLIACFRGTPQLERQVHRLLASKRSHSEWFDISGPVQAFRDLVFGMGVATVPDWATPTFGSPERLERERLVAVEELGLGSAGPDTFSEIVERFGGVPKLAGLIGVRPGTLHEARRIGQLAVKHWPALILAARRAGEEATSRGDDTAAAWFHALTANRLMLITVAAESARRARGTA